MAPKKFTKLIDITLEEIVGSKVLESQVTPKLATRENLLRWGEALASFKWGQVDLLLQNHDFFPAPQNRRLIIELCRFLMMKAMVLDLNADKLSPSGMIDVAWHSVILFPKAYTAICASLLPPEVSAAGHTLDHNPLGLDDYNNSLRYQYTLDLYRDTFGSEAPELFWPPNVPSDWVLEDEEAPDATEEPSAPGPAPALPAPAAPFTSTWPHTPQPCASQELEMGRSSLGAGSGRKRRREGRAAVGLESPAKKGQGEGALGEDLGEALGVEPLGEGALGEALGVEPLGEGALGVDLGEALGVEPLGEGALGEDLGEALGDHLGEGALDGEGPAAEQGPPVRVRVRTLLGEEFTLQVGAEATVATMKWLVARREGTPRDRQRLLLGDLELEDDAPLAAHRHELAAHTVHLLQKLKGC